MQIIKTIALLLSLSYGLVGHSLEKDTYLRSLKNFEYQNAIEIALEKNTPEGLHEFELAKLLYFAGQEKFDFNETIHSNYTDYIKSLINLKVGYAALYENLYNTESFTRFNEAYSYAIKSENVELQKICLYAILEVFNFELEQTQSNYKTYLQKLEKLPSDKTDLFRIEYSRINFIHDTANSIEELPENLFKKIDSIYYEGINNEVFKILYFGRKGYQFELKKETRKAIEMYHSVNRLVKDEPFLKYLKFRAFIRLSEIRRKEKNIELALIHLDSSRNYINKADSLRSLYFLNIYSSKNNFDTGNYKTAYTELLDATKYSIDQETNKNSKEIVQLNIKYETAEKEKQILIEQAAKKQNRNIAFGLGGSLAALSIIAFLVYKNAKRKQYIAEQQRELEISKTEKILKEQELTTIDAMLEGQEKERQRLAGDLHDSVGATLAAARLQFTHLSDNRDKAATLEELYHKTGKLLDDAYHEVRAMAHIKNSGVLAKDGLLPAVEKLAKNASVNGKLQIEVTHFGLEERIENNLEITVFRILQELITNIIKHARASEVTISITQHDDMLNIIVEDNGIGFTPLAIQKKEGMGLSSIEKRIEHMEGTLEVDSTLGKGTNILIDIPI
ncbi:sensor histidine kinase [Jejudonia soesokkakensis]|uniref:Oxygen sensor histidine kinase NreB n=1 Tax=Jejudonia soesokkakensis TaxID=1323432 RepID=A0ABW2MY21_9FLAO